MGIVFDKLLSKLMHHSHQLKMVSSDPASGKDTEMIYNTTSDQLKIYYSGSWYVLHSLSLDGDQYIFQDGDEFVFQNGDAYIFQA